MKGIQTLAGHDMVLALSESTINYQFEMLQNLGTIKSDWAVLIGNVTAPQEGEKPFFIDKTDTGFANKRSQWISLQKQIGEAQAKGDYAKIGSLINDLKIANANFDFGWDAFIDPPEVSIKDKDTQNLTLQIHFEDGTLYYRDSPISAVKEFDLSDCTYAFTVPIGKLKINKDQMIKSARDEVSQVIRDSGLSDDDFTIESLFLKFEDANISSFDKNKSKFPEDATLPLQIAVQNYFNLIITGSNNPYILGYGVSRQKISNSEKAMFQPTSLAFSSSYSAKRDPKNPVAGQFNAFNFLMMLNNRTAKHDQNTGVLPQSLIELGQDTSSTTDGVFGIQNDHFKKYVQSLDKYVHETFKALENVEITQNFTKGVMKAKRKDKRKDDQIQTDFTITRETPKNNPDGNGIKIRYKIEMDIDVQIYAWVVKIKETTLSTSGQHTKGDINKKGAPGYLDFVITAGKTGRFDMAHKLQEPVIAFDEPTGLIKGKFWEDFFKVLTFIFSWIILVIDAIVTKIVEDLGRDSAINQNALIRQLNELDVLNQTNRVILPLGKIYTYKNLRYIREKDIVAYDISYAPVAD